MRAKKAIVTGASRGIGKATAKKFAEEGADVVISYLSNTSGAESIVKEIQGISRRAKCIQVDFSNEKDIHLFFEQSLDFLDGIDVLINCAAAYDTTPFLELSPSTLRHLLKVGVEAPMYLTQCVAKEMIKEKKGGSIINISSIAGLHPYENRVAHCTTKSALNMLTQTMALELLPYEIYVNAIAPRGVVNEESLVSNELLPSDIVNSIAYGTSFVI